MAKLPQQYDPHAHESVVYKKWEAANAFAPSPDAPGRPFVIILPPPNITGNLHVGHALQDCIMDVLIRYHRLQGEPTLWLPGLDHAAIATNRVLEKQLQKEGTTRQQIGRDAFLKRTDQWYQQTGNTIVDQMKRLGASADWSKSRFTMDKKYIQAVQHAFIEYYRRGYIYRGRSLVNWDPATQTTVSDLEIEWRTEKAPLYTLRYGPFAITTARPETKFGDKYVVMHPDDTRYSQYKHGQQFTAEWINGPITATIIKDDSIDRSFGTGVMTITPRHDAVDFAIAQRHQLDMEPIIDLNGRLLPIAGEFSGMAIAAARPKIVAKLQAKGLIVEIDENYKHNIALNERSGGVIEPQVMRQWFINMQKLKNQTIAAVDSDHITFVPPRWKKHFLQWMAEVHDWNINRQIWLGHRLPVWWQPATRDTDHEEGNYVVSATKPDSNNWEQDPDVLDTWFSSALWPFAALGWPEPTADLKKFYPTSVLVTARDIIYLWVARMIFSGLEFMQQIPFRQVLIHPTVLTKTGQRMSKSLGTGLDPLDLIARYGSDATRFGLLHQLNYDQQAMRFDEAAIVAARNFANKLWNITRFISALPDRDESSFTDEWITAALHRLTGEVSTLLDQLKVGEAARRLYDFVWNDFADWYVEILKSEGTTTVARQSFQQLLILLHPFLPHLTEVLWEQLGEKNLLITSQWPIRPSGGSVKESGHNAITELKDIISTVRRARALLGLPAAASLTVYLPSPPAMPAVIERLGRMTLVAAPPAGALCFPLRSSQSLQLTAPHITADHLAATKNKLNAQVATATRRLASQQALLERMRAKAKPSAIAQKETEIFALQQHLDELHKSVQILSNTV